MPRTARTQSRIHNAFNSRLSTIALALAAATQLSACFPLVAAGAGVGAVSVDDRRSTAAQWKDSQIAGSVADNIDAHFGSMTHVNVNCYDGGVLLTGEVPDEATQAGVLSLAKETANVRNVYNETGVMLPSSLAGRAEDTGVTAKVKAKLIETKGVSPVNVKVYTERDVVYLMGLVSRSEGALAAKAVSEVNGVDRVVTLFEYLD